MDVRITKGSDRDFIEAERVDGTVVTATFPKKGSFPHDAIHLVVESELQYKTGFWGRVFDGATPEAVGALAKAGGHSSSTRAKLPTEEVVELLHAERIVECFEVEMWGEPSDMGTFRSVLGAACSESKVGNPSLSDENIRNIRVELSSLLIKWRQLSVGKSLMLSWS